MIYVIWCTVWCPHSFYFHFSWFQCLTLWQVCCGGRWCYHLVLPRSLALVKVWGFRSYGFGSRPSNICTCYYLEHLRTRTIRPHFPLVYPDVCWYPSNHICSQWIVAEAKTMVVEARKKGTWVLLQNCHLYKMLSRSQLLRVKHLGGGIRSQPIEIGDSRMTRFFIGWWFQILESFVHPVKITETRLCEHHFRSVWLEHGSFPIATVLRPRISPVEIPAGRILWCS